MYTYMYAYRLSLAAVCSGTLFPLTDFEEYVVQRLRGMSLSPSPFLSFPSSSSLSPSLPLPLPSLPLPLRGSSDDVIMGISLMLASMKTTLISTELPLHVLLRVSITGLTCLVPHYQALDPISLAKQTRPNLSSEYWSSKLVPTCFTGPSG